MRIVDQCVEIVHRRAGNVAALEQGQRLGGGERAENAGDDAEHFVQVLPARFERREMRMGFVLVEPAEAFEERLPVLVGIDERAHIAVAGRVGAAIRIDHAEIAGLADRRIEGAAGEVIAEHELRHGFEHRQLDRLALAGALAAEQRGEDDVRGIEPDNAIDHRHRHVARLLPAASAIITGSAQMPWMRSS